MLLLFFWFHILFKKKCINIFSWIVYWPVNWCRFLCSYVLGSAEQQMAAMGSEDKPVTLEFQEIIEQQMLKVNLLSGHLIS